jgi:flagellar biosynthesis/type III secretory pathway protein FliH
MIAAMLFADFNDIPEADRDTPPPPPVQEPPADPTADIRQQAWTEGYLTARRAHIVEDPAAASMARLLSSLDTLRTESAAMAKTASRAIASLILDTAIAVADEAWSASLPGRVQALMDRVRPALTVAPEFVLREASGVERRFADIGALTLALDGGIGCEDVTIQWQQGRASIGRDVLLEDLREAVRPLSIGLVNEQSSRQPS